MATFTDQIVHIYAFIDFHTTFTGFHEGLRMLMKLKIITIYGECCHERSEIKFMND